MRWSGPGLHKKPSGTRRRLAVGLRLFVNGLSTGYQRFVVGRPGAGPGQCSPVPLGNGRTPSVDGRRPPPWPPTHPRWRPVGRTHAHEGALTLDDNQPHGDRLLRRSPVPWLGTHVPVSVRGGGSEAHPVWVAPEGYPSQHLKGSA